MYQANALLCGSIVPERKATALFAIADGSGTHTSASVARHIAVSEALERWAITSISQSARRSSYGFDLDLTSNGMAAFPGLIAKQARRFARLEAVERHCLFGWWEGLYRGIFRMIRWDEIHADSNRGAVRGTRGDSLRPNPRRQPLRLRTRCRRRLRGGSAACHDRAPAPRSCSEALFRP
jgi:ribosomal protein S12 methylthiotransferase accessory factor YcaO